MCDGRFAVGVRTLVSRLGCKREFQLPSQINIRSLVATGSKTPAPRETARAPIDLFQGLPREMSITYQTLDPQGRQNIEYNPRFVDLRHSPLTVQRFINALETEITAGNATATHGIRDLYTSLMLRTDVSGQIVLPLAYSASPFGILAS